MGPVSSLAAFALTVGAILSLIVIRRCFLDMVRHPRPHKGAPRVVSEFTRPAVYCPPTQAVHRQRKGAYRTMNGLLLAEISTHTGRNFAAVERRLNGAF